MHSDYRELLSILNARRVKYLVIGAYAVGIYAQPRATKELDILIKADPENANAVFAALAEFGTPLGTLSVADFSEPGAFFRIGHEPVGLDILTEIPGVEFDTAWSRRVEAVLDTETDLVGNVMSCDDLVAAKRAAGRRHDLADIEAIEWATAPAQGLQSPPEPASDTSHTTPDSAPSDPFDSSDA